MFTLVELKSAFESIAVRLNAPQECAHFSTTPQHNGSPHIELVGDKFAYVVTERGEEYERRTTANPDDLLYWLTSDLTFELASRYELAHRIPEADSRRILFKKQTELLGSINQDWQLRKQTEHASILSIHPFYDRRGKSSPATETAHESRRSRATENLSPSIIDSGDTE